MVVKKKMFIFYIFHQENNGAATLVGVFIWDSNCTVTNVPGVYSGMQLASLILIVLYSRYFRPD